MKVGELVLDYIQALVWPALIAVGVFWLFRSEVSGLFKKVGDLIDRIKRLRVPGGFEADLAAVQESIEEQAEKAVTAADREARERAVEGLLSDALKLGWFYSSRIGLPPPRPDVLSEGDKVRVAWPQKVNPYHSINPTDPDVYHNYADCPRGNLIPPHNRRPGTGGYRRCGMCQDMDGARYIEPQAQR